MGHDLQFEKHWFRAEVLKPDCMIARAVFRNKVVRRNIYVFYIYIKHICAYLQCVNYSRDNYFHSVSF